MLGLMSAIEEPEAPVVTVARTIGSHEKFTRMVTFYHDIEQDYDSEAKPQECRRMVQEFLKLEKSYQISASYNVVGKLSQQQPDLAREIGEAGGEVAFHSYNHHPDWQPKYYASEVRLCREASAFIKGYRSPRSKWDQTTLESLWQNGFLWNAESDKSQEPYFIHKGLVRLPIAGDDWPLYTGALSVEQWIERFQDCVRTRTYVAFGSHDTVTSLSPEQRLKAWERLLQIAVESNVLIVTFSEAADLFRRSRLSKYYTEVARGWNQRTKQLYRTKRFQELIRKEAEAFVKPVILDLGSGGGVLTTPLIDLAGKIYCIDHAPAMVADVDGRVETIIGEVTDSTLTDNSVDLIVCARVMEYLFWPERVADEIRRVGRPGATYLVTVPAVCDSMSRLDVSAPDRIRRYFTEDEIFQWSEPIGPGRLLGIQYDPFEPGNAEEERHFRAKEEMPAGDVRPTNWVFIGTVKNKGRDRRYRPAVPLSSFDFVGNL